MADVWAVQASSPPLQYLPVLEGNLSPSLVKALLPHCENSKIYQGKGYSIIMGYMEGKCALKLERGRDQNNSLSAIEICFVLL